MVYRSIAAAVGLCVASSLVWAADLPDTGHASRRVPKTPIENLIVIVGENQTFDGVFATYTKMDGLLGFTANVFRLRCNKNGTQP